MSSYLFVYAKNRYRRIPNKMSTVRINDIEKESELSDLLITRMSALRYSDYVDKADVVISFSYIFYFSLAGGLVIIVRYSII